MREVIQALLDAEAEAKRVVEQARVEAERIVSDARKQAAEMETSAAQQIRAEAGQRIERAAESARAEKQKRLAAEQARIKEEFRPGPATLEVIVKAAVDCICGRT